LLAFDVAKRYISEHSFYFVSVNLSGGPLKRHPDSPSNTGQMTMTALSKVIIYKSCHFCHL